MTRFMLVWILHCNICVFSNLISSVFPEKMLCLSSVEPLTNVYKWKSSQQIKVIYFLNLIQINYVLNGMPGNGRENDE